MRVAERLKQKLHHKRSIPVRALVVGEPNRCAAAVADRNRVLRHWGTLNRAQVVSRLCFTTSYPKLVSAIWQLNVNLLCAGLFRQASQNTTKTPAESFPLLEAVEFTNEGLGTLAVRPESLDGTTSFIHMVMKRVEGFMSNTKILSQRAFSRRFLSATRRCAGWHGLEQLVGTLIERAILDEYVEHLEREADAVRVELEEAVEVCQCRKGEAPCQQHSCLSTTRNHQRVVSKMPTEAVGTVSPQVESPSFEATAPCIRSCLPCCVRLSDVAALGRTPSCSWSPFVVHIQADDQPLCGESSLIPNDCADAGGEDALMHESSALTAKLEETYRVTAGLVGFVVDCEVGVRTPATSFVPTDHGSWGAVCSPSWGPMPTPAHMCPPTRPNAWLPSSSGRLLPWQHDWVVSPASMGWVPFRQHVLQQVAEGWRVPHPHIPPHTHAGAVCDGVHDCTNAGVWSPVRCQTALHHPGVQHGWHDV